jgi:hypothetical protein
MITKTFFLTKEIRAIRTKSLRGKKSLRDHRAMTPNARRARAPRRDRPERETATAAPRKPQGWPPRPPCPTMDYRPES